MLHATEVDQALQIFVARPLSSIRNHRKTPFPRWTMESQSGLLVSTYLPLVGNILLILMVNIYVYIYMVNIYG